MTGLPLIPLLPTLGMGEMLVILLIVLIFFGVGKLPQIGEALGKGIRQFRDASQDAERKPAAQIEVTTADADEVSHKVKG